MSSENNFKGAAGQSIITALLQDIGFSTIGNPDPDIGTDILATDWQLNPACRDLVFHFQVKRLYIRKITNAWSFSISRALVEKSLLHPTFVVVVDGVASKPTYHFCSIFDWILENPGWNEHPGKKITFSRKYFTPIDNLEAAIELLIREADRVSGNGSSLWVPNHQPNTFVTQRDLFKLFGVLGHAVPPDIVILKLSEMTGSADYASLHHSISTIRSNEKSKLENRIGCEPVISRWLDLLNGRKKTSEKEGQVSNFLEFVSAVRGIQRNQFFSMPDYLWESISAWRTFISIYPRSFQIIDTVLRNPNMWSPHSKKGAWSFSQVAGAIGLASSAAYSTDPVVSRLAHESLRRLSIYMEQHSRNCLTYSQYELLHQYYLSMSQVDSRWEKPCIDFLARVGRMKSWEMKLHRRYYNAKDDAMFRHVVSQKLESPQNRDALLHQVHLTQKELVERDGVFAIDDDVKQSGAIESAGQ